MPTIEPMAVLSSQNDTWGSHSCRFHTHTHTHTHTHNTHTHKHTHTHTHTQTHTHNTHKHTNTHTQLYASRQSNAKLIMVEHKSTWSKKLFSSQILCLSWLHCKHQEGNMVSIQAMFSFWLLSHNAQLRIQLPSQNDIY